MKKSTTAMVSMLLAILLLASFSYPAYAQKVTGVKKVMDHTSIASVSTYTDGVNITYKIHILTITRLHLLVHSMGL